MRRRCCHAFVVLLFIHSSYSQNPVGNELDFDDQKVVTLGPPRDGFQRAVFDEVSMNDINQLPVEDITKTKGDIDAYDDKFVDLREEDPLFIPRLYRNETVGDKAKSKEAAGRAGTETFSSTGQQFQTPGRTNPPEAVRRTFAPVNLPTRPPFQQPPFRPSQPFLQPNFAPQPPPSPPRLIAQQQLPSQISFRPQTVSQLPSFVSQQQQLQIFQKPLSIPVPLPAQPRPAFRPIQRFVWPLPTPTPLTTVQSPLTQPSPITAQPQQATSPAPQQSTGRPLPPVQEPPQNTQPTPAPAPVHFRPTDTHALPQQPIRPHPQPPHAPPRIGPPPPSSASSDSLRTGVCRASIFYISTPLHGPTRHSFTHFAITVSTDQCARTCHEFNCAIAHYDPSTGRCQFNPSTAFAIREGQCPPWPATHYKNNIHSSISLRIFCVQCHRPIRRGQIRNRGNRFRTTALRTQFTGRIPSSLRNSVLAKAQSVLSAQPGVITESSFPDINSKLFKQNEPAAEISSSKQQKQRTSKYGNNDPTEMDDKERKDEENDEIGKLQQSGEEFTNEAVNYSKLVLKKVQSTGSRTTYTKLKRPLTIGSGAAASNATNADTSVNIIRVLPSDFAPTERDFQ